MHGLSIREIKGSVTTLIFSTALLINALVTNISSFMK